MLTPSLSARWNLYYFPTPPPKNRLPFHKHLEQLSPCEKCTHKTLFGNLLFSLYNVSQASFHTSTFSFSVLFYSLNNVSRLMSFVTFFFCRSFLPACPSRCLPRNYPWGLEFPTSWGKILRWDFCFIQKEETKKINFKYPIFYPILERIKDPNSQYFCCSWQISVLKLQY